MRRCVGEVAVPLQDLGVGVVRIRCGWIQLDLTFRRRECAGAISIVPRQVGETVVAEWIVRILRDEIPRCGVVVSGKLCDGDPETAAKITRAILKGSKWTEANPTAAAELAVEKKYIAASKEITAPLLWATNQIDASPNNSISFIKPRASRGSRTQQFHRGNGPAEYSFLSTLMAGARSDILSATLSGGWRDVSIFATAFTALSGVKPKKMMSTLCPMVLVDGVDVTAGAPGPA